MADSKRGLGRPLSGVNATGRRGKDFTERDLLARYIFGRQLVKVGANEASEESGSNIVGVSFCGTGEQWLANKVVPGMIDRMSQV